MRSGEGQDPGRRLRRARQRHSLLSSREPPRAAGDLAADRRQEEYVDALFRELEEDPAVPLFARRAGRILLGTGLVLSVVGFLAMLGVQAPDQLLSWVLGVNILAVLCVAAGILLLPESSPPSPSRPDAAGNLDVLRLGPVRFRSSLPHLPGRHARH